MTNLAYLTEQEFYRTVVALLDAANAKIAASMERMQEATMIASELGWADDLYEAAAVQKLMYVAKRYIVGGHFTNGAMVHEYLMEMAMGTDRPISSTSQSSNLMGTHFHFQAIRLAKVFAKYTK